MDDGRLWTQKVIKWDVAVEVLRVGRECRGLRYGRRWRPFLEPCKSRLPSYNHACPFLFSGQAPIGASCQPTNLLPTSQLLPQARLPTWLLLTNHSPSQPNLMYEKNSRPLSLSSKKTVKEYRAPRLPWSGPGGVAIAIAIIFAALHGLHQSLQHIPPRP